MPHDFAIKLSQLLQAAAALALAWRLLQFRLLSHMQFMFALQIWTVVSSVSGFVFNRDAASYFWFYALAIPVSAIINTFAVSELLAMVFVRYPGIRTVGRWIMFFSVGLAVLLSLLWARSSWQGAASSSTLAFMELAQRSVVFSLAVFILCILFFLSRYPLRLPRNFSISTSLFCTIFLTETLVILLDTLTPTLQNQYIDLAQMLVSIVCLASWAILLRPLEAAPPPDISLPLGNEQTLLAQLTSMNETMSRAARR